MDCSPPGSSVGFSRQEYGSGLPFPFSRGSSWPRDWMQVSRITGRFFTIWTTREAYRKASQKSRLGKDTQPLRVSCFVLLFFYRGYSYLFHGVVAKINGIISHMWILKNACPIRKQRMLQPLQNSSWVVSPEGTQDTNRRPSAKPSATADGPWGDSRWESTRSWDAYQRNDISELKLLHLPIRRKPSVPQFEISGFL